MNIFSKLSDIVIVRTCTYTLQFIYNTYFLPILGKIKKMAPKLSYLALCVYHLMEAAEDDVRSESVTVFSVYTVLFV